MTTEKKYRLTNESITIDGRKLYRIEAIKDFYYIKKGSVGGFIESEKNLSQAGSCWVFNDAMVYDRAKVYDDARIYNNAEVYDDARVFGNAEVYGDAEIYNNASVCGNANVFGDAEVFGYAEVYGDAIINGNARIIGDAKVANNSDYIVFKNWWSSGRYFTWTRSNNMWKVGCFYGTGEELIAKAYKDSELSGREYERVVKYVESILKDSKL